jgi:hypothetical protein
MLSKIAAVLFVSFGVFIVYKIASPDLMTKPPVIGDPVTTPTQTTLPTASPVAGSSPERSPKPRETIRPFILPSPSATLRPLPTPLVRPMQLNGIHGRVTNAQGQPLAGVQVYVEERPAWKGETDAEGRFFIRCGETQTPLTLVAQKPRYQLWQARVSFDNGWPEQEIILKPALELFRPVIPKRGVPRQPNPDPRLQL